MKKKEKLKIDANAINYPLVSGTINYEAVMGNNEPQSTAYVLGGATASKAGAVVDYSLRTEATQYGQQVYVTDGLYWIGTKTIELYPKHS